MIPRLSCLALPRRGRAALLASASAFLLATGATAQEASRDTWIGRSIGLTPPQRTYLGRAPVVPPDSRAADNQVTVSARLFAADDAEKPKDTLAFVEVDAVTGDSYRVEAPRADFERLHLEMVMRGEASGSPLEPEASAAGMSNVIGRSWSDGIPNFVRFGIGDGVPANHNIYRRIGQIGSGCTGTLIGPRHVLTAAHCVVDNVTFEVYSATFRPRRDWTEGTMSPTAPFGSRAFVAYVFPQEYWNGTCDFNNGLDCNKYDIALGILSSDMALPNMGYWYAPVATLNTWSKFMRGYPRCFDTDDNGNQIPDVEAPPNCTRSTLYGDRSACNIGDWSSPDGDGWNRELWVDCDGARGMSGSAMYTSNSPGGLVALGVYSQFVCSAANCANHPQGEFPNTITRITPEYAQMISMAKAEWSCPSGTCD